MCGVMFGPPALPSALVLALCLVNPSSQPESKAKQQGRHGSQPRRKRSIRRAGHSSIQAGSSTCRVGQNRAPEVGSNTRSISGRNK